MNVIEAQNVVKHYGKKVALKGVSFQVKEGVIFGLLGPNGAGKTTFVKSMLNLVGTTEGSITINGVPSRLEKSRENIAFLPEKFNFLPYYTVTGALKFYAKMYNQDSSNENINRVLDKINLSEQANQRVKTLSKGQLQRVGLASLLVSKAKILVIDEPFSGLDPIGVRELKELIQELKASGHTIFLNTHLLAEVEKIVDVIAILNKGDCLACGPLKELTQGKSLDDYFHEIVRAQSK